MGHIRLGKLPRTRSWDRVVALIAGGAQAEQVANATMRAAERVLGQAFHDTGLVETLWLVLRLPLAARSDDFPRSLRDHGLNVSDAPGLMEILGAFTDAVDTRLINNRGRTDLGEMAQMAAVETYAEIVGPHTQGLFGVAPDDVRRAFAQLATTAQVSHLGRHFFGRLIYKCLDFYLSRALADHVGEGKRFATLRQVAEFSEALQTHCGQAARVVEIFSGEWFSKHRWETRGELPRNLTAKFAHGAMRKLIDELKQGARADG
jgi:hypothetical protein